MINPEMACRDLVLSKTQICVTKNITLNDKHIYPSYAWRFVNLIQDRDKIIVVGTQLQAPPAI